MFTEKEKNTIQIMRCIALMMVVFHHVLRAIGCKYSNEIIAVLASIHVQVFFLLAGFLFEANVDKYKRNGIKRFLIGKAKELMIPYFCWTWLFSLILFIIKLGIPQIYSIIVQKGYAGKSLLEMIIDPLVFRNPQYESLWFVYVLFILFVLNWLIPVNNAKWVIWCAEITIAMVISYYFYNTTMLLPYRVVRYFQWFYLGRICVSNKEKILTWLSKRRIIWILIVLFVLLTFTTIRDPIKETVNNTFIRTVLYGIERILFTTCGIAVIYVMAIKAAEINLTKKVGLYVGDRSYMIYLIHNPWLVVPFSLVAGKLGSTSVIAGIIISFLVLLLSVMIGNLMKKSTLISKAFLGIYYQKQV